jgi:hypothetical protein
VISRRLFFSYAILQYPARAQLPSPKTSLSDILMVILDSALRAPVNPFKENMIRQLTAMMAPAPQKNHVEILLTFLRSFFIKPVSPNF